MRKPPKPNKTGILLLSLLCVFVLLLVLYFAVLSPFFSEEGPETPGTTVSTKPGEGAGLVNGMVMMFPRVERSSMASLRVFNNYNEKTGKYEEYCFTKDTEDKDQDGDTADFIIEGHPVNIYNEEKFSQLVVDAGYTLCLGRLDALDFSEGADPVYARYGLSESQHPTYYVLTTHTGESYKVYIGAKSPDGNYYARLEGREAVYVLYSTLKNSLLAPLSFFVEPGLTFEGDTTYGYIYIRNFSIFHDRSLVDGMFGDGAEKPSFGEGSTLDPFVMFTFLNSTDRDVYHASSVYAMLHPSNAYTADDIAVDAALQKLPGLTGTEVLKLGLSDTDFAEGGLLEHVAYTIYYEMPYNITYDENEDPYPGSYIKNVLFITPLSPEDNTYTVGSLSYRDDGEVFYNMIAKVEYKNLSFVEYSLFDWIMDEMFSVSIDNVAGMEFSSAYGDYVFSLEGDGTSGQVVYELHSGFRWEYKGRKFPFAVNEQGYCEDISQFRDLYLLLLQLDYGGEIATDGWSEEEIAALMANDSACILTFILTLEDGREMTYRFYPYTERHCMVSVSGDGMEDVTCFYTSSTAVRRLANATYQLMHGIEIKPDHRYEVN
jgi:hypothetical protein